MVTLDLRYVGAVLAGVALLAALLWAIRTRQFSRYAHGTVLQLAVTLAGSVLMAALIAGWLGYRASARVLEEGVTNEMRDVGAIVESESRRQIVEMGAQLTALATSVGAAHDRGASATDLVDRLRAAQQFNARFLQLRLFDADGSLLAESAVEGSTEPVNRVAVAFAQSGTPYVSDATMSTVFHREVLFQAVPVLDAGRRVRFVASAIFDLRAQLADLMASTRFNVSGYAVIVNGDGRIIAHPNPARLDADISHYPAVQAARVSRSGTGAPLEALNDAGQPRLFVYRTITNPSTLARQPWVLLTEIDATELHVALRHLRWELFGGIALLLVVAALVARRLAVAMDRPMRELAALAATIGAGDLTGRAELGGRDTVGQLAASLNRMAEGLRERDRVKEVFGRYIATQVSDELLSGQVALGGEARRVTMLISDIRSFTTMSEHMRPEEVVAFLNDYFSEMVDAVFEYGGMLDKFMGDGLLAVFGAFGTDAQHERHAVQAALRMRALVAKINGERSVQGLDPIAIGIGIHTDTVVVGNIGSRKRLEYTVVGDGVNTTARLQTLNKEFHTTLLISDTTHAAVADEFECRPMEATVLRGKSTPLQSYEVVSAKQAAPLA